MADPGEFRFPPLAEIGKFRLRWWVASENRPDRGQFVGGWVKEAIHVRIMWIGGAWEHYAIEISDMKFPEEKSDNCTNQRSKA